MTIAKYPVSTLAYMRQTSTLLLTAVLAASAKFFHRSLRQHLLMHAQTILGRALIVGECNIAVIQALIILSSWKEATDRSSWVKMGTAIRLGYQLGLHVPRKEPLPLDEGEARLIADSERTWIVLSCESLRPRVVCRHLVDLVRSGQDVGLPSSFGAKTQLRGHFQLANGHAPRRCA